MADLYNVYTIENQEVPVAENLDLKQAERLNETLNFLEYLDNLNKSSNALRNNPLDQDNLSALVDLVETSNPNIDVFDVVLVNRASFSKALKNKSKIQGRERGEFSKQVDALVESLFLEYQGELYQVLTESTLQHLKDEFDLELDFKLCYSAIASRVIIDCESLSKMTINSFQKFKGFSSLSKKDKDHIISLLTFVNSFVDVEEHAIQVSANPNYLEETFSNLGIYEVIALFKTKDFKTLCDVVNSLTFNAIPSLHVPKYALLCLYLIANMIPRRFKSFLEQNPESKEFGIFANDAEGGHSSWVNSLRLPNEDGEFVHRVDIDYLIARAQGTEIPTQYALAILPLLANNPKRGWGIDIFENVSFQTFKSERRNQQTYYELDSQNFSIANYVEKFEIEGFSGASRVDQSRKNDPIYTFYILTAIFRACAIAAEPNKAKRATLTESQISDRIMGVVKEYNKPLNKPFKNTKKGGNSVTSENNSKSALYNWFNLNKPLVFSFDSEEIVENYICVDFGGEQGLHYYAWCMEFLTAYAESQKGLPGLGHVLAYLKKGHKVGGGSKLGIDIAVDLIEALREDGLKVEPYDGFSNLKGNVDLDTLNKIDYYQLASRSSSSSWTNEFIDYCLKLVPYSKGFIDTLLSSDKGSVNGLRGNGYYHCFQAALLIENTDSSSFKDQFHYEVVDLSEYTKELNGVYVAISKNFSPVELAAGATKLTGCCQQLANHGTEAAIQSFYGDPQYMTYYVFEPNAELQEAGRTKFLCTTNTFVNRFVYPKSTFANVKKQNNLELVEGDTRLINKLVDNEEFLKFIEGKDQIAIQNFDGFEPVRFISVKERVLERAKKALRVVSSMIEDQNYKIGTSLHSDPQAGILSTSDFRKLTGIDFSFDVMEQANKSSYRDGDPANVIPDFFGVQQIFLASSSFKEMIVEVGSFKGDHPSTVQVQYVKNNGETVAYEEEIEWDYLRYMFAWPTGDEFIPFMGRVSFECPESVQSKVEEIAQNLMYPEWFYGRPLERDGEVYDTKRFLEMRTPKEGLFVNDVEVSPNPPRSNPRKRRSRRRR